MDRLGQLKSSLLIFKAADFACYGNLKLGMQLRDHCNDDVFLLKQIRAVVAFASDTLGTAQVDVNCVTIVLNKFCRLKQVFGIVSTELDE